MSWTISLNWPFSWIRDHPRGRHVKSGLSKLGTHLPFFKLRERCFYKGNIERIHVFEKTITSLQNYRKQSILLPVSNLFLGLSLNHPRIRKLFWFICEKKRFWVYASHISTWKKELYTNCSVYTIYIFLLIIVN